MIGTEGCREIRFLKGQGKGIREIAGIMGVSRNTVRKYLRSQGTEPSYGPRPNRGSKLEPYYTYLHLRIRSAVPHRLPAPVLYREIRVLGFTGSERLVRLYVRTLYPDAKHGHPVRFETPPIQARISCADRVTP